MAESSVFISYSRKDYHFAESLAFHLLRRGVPAWLDVKDLKPGNDWERDLEQGLAAASTLLLVASPHSVESERVRAEWQHALQRGCRIVVVRFRNAPLPAELQACDAVDFRGAFGRAMRTLMSRLAPEADRGLPAPVRDTGSWLPLPPWVIVIALTLAIPLLGYFAAANWTLAPDEEYRMAILIFMPFAVLAMLWFFCIAFLRRRMGMTRLALCLLVMGVVFALPMLAHSVPRLSFLATEATAAAFGRYWHLGAFLVAVPLAGLCILMLVRPEDLLRWTPTGKAWTAYRIGHVANAGFGRAELAFQFEQIARFALAHDPADAPMAQRLREQLTALGAVETPAPGEAVTPVRLLTNRTELAWIDTRTEHLRGEGVTVVGTRIGLPESLDWLWRRQWIDFRGWDVRRADRARAMPQVPDAVTQPRRPARVARVHHVLCAIAALVFTLGGALSEQTGDATELSLNDPLGMITIAAAIAWALIAHRLVRRTRPAPLLVRAAAINCAVTAIAVGFAFHALAGGTLTVPRMAVAAAFLAVAWVWLSRQRAALAFWLPASKPAAGAGDKTLGNYRDWSTAIWVTFYLFVWMPVLGLD
jgi:hypothetical protein